MKVRVISVLWLVSLSAGQGVAQPGATAAASNYSGTYGDVILDGSTTFPDAGVLLRAGSRGTVAAQTGSSDPNSKFVVFNSSNTELLRVQSDGWVTVGSGAVDANLSIRTPTQNALHLGTFGNSAALAINRRVSDGTWTNTALPTASITLETKTNDSSIVFRTANANQTLDRERMRIDKDGGITVGNWWDSPNGILRVRGGANPVSITSTNSIAYGTGIEITDLLPGTAISSGVLMDMRGNSMLRVGNLEIGGTGAPELHPNGVPLNVRGSVTIENNLSVTGDVTANGNIAAKYQDVAEWVDATSDLPPGTVVVLDQHDTDRVTTSATPYDTRVAGVVSEQPGVLLGVPGSGKEKVATTGRVKVKVKVDAATPIRIGDLLVTSDTPGVAMRSTPMDINGRPFHQPGTIIGKALEPLSSGEGEILVLLSLQ